MSSADDVFALRKTLSAASHCDVLELRAVYLATARASYAAVEAEMASIRIMLDAQEAELVRLSKAAHQ